MAGVDPPTCYTCDVVRRKKDSPAEVWYDRVQRWTCLECHLTEKALQKVKGKGTVREVLHKCSSCERPESTPCCFCYGCSQFLCEECTSRDVCVRSMCCRLRPYTVGNMTNKMKYMIMLSFHLTITYIIQMQFYILHSNN